MKGKIKSSSVEMFVFIMMMFAGGYFGAFTYSIRGGVFCNAQTGNFVLMAMALGRGEIRSALYYLIPISAYLLGAVVSEILNEKISIRHHVQWDAVFIIFEMAVVLILGFLPESYPVQITQIAINFIASMQYNTFKKVNGIAMATTFCTNHVRQSGIAIAGLFDGQKRREAAGRLKIHLLMLLSFLLGGVISTYLSLQLLGRAIWFSLLPLSIVLFIVIKKDLRLHYAQPEA